jgi:hypothetical protein
VNRVFPLLLIIGLAVAGGAYNYHRNADLEEQTGFRPYGGIADADLEVLAAAYEQELETLRERFSRMGEGSTRDSGSSLISDRVRDFERSQKSNDRQVGLRREILEREVTMQKIQQELQLRRAGSQDPWMRFLRRVTTI